MIHILASHYRSEFLATPQLIRFDYAEGESGREPTLLVKASTLLLKYIVLGVGIRLFFTRIGDKLLYVLKIDDDDRAPSFLWSILERDEEMFALTAAVQQGSFQTFLFNELAMNVAWTKRRGFVDGNYESMFSGVSTGPVNLAEMTSQITPIVDGLNDETPCSKELVIITLDNADDWSAVSNKLITSHGTVSPIELFDSDEGGQQEQLAVWLTDELHPLGVHLSPQIPKGKNSRELTDVLLSYQYGTILIESKGLAVLCRETLPNRTKLARDVASRVRKAVSQLKGAIRMLKANVPVTTISGSQVEVERTQPIHAIVIIPDMDLVQDRNILGQSIIQDFMEATGGFIHIVDVSELLRIVQAAEEISSRGERTTPMMAFDYYLVERAKRACDAGTLCIRVLLRIVDE